MDTASHVVVGVGLGGLAQLDPVIASSPSLQTAVIIGTIVGSQAPDFDTITRLYNNESYIKNHRGVSHSLPAIILWTVLITACINLFLNDPHHILRLGSWILLAVVLHVFMDLFNTYGTQAMIPFSKKWISWNIIHIFDPFIFTTHIIACVFWISALATPSVIFPTLYGTIILYYIARTIYSKLLLSHIKALESIKTKDTRLMIIPTIRQTTWHVVKKHPDNSYSLGSWRKGALHWNEHISSDHHALIEYSKAHPSVASFLYFTKHVVVHRIEHHWGYEVRWSDVRYRYRKQFPFVAIVFYNKEKEALASYVGWLNDKKLYKRLYTQARLENAEN